MNARDLLVFTADDVENALWSNVDRVLGAVDHAYRLLSDCTNPESTFLRFDGEDSPNRIMALPAATPGSAGIKWVSSVPRNVERGLPRASAVIIMNDRSTGRPVALLEASEISLLRTAASAVVIARAIDAEWTSVGVIGTGALSRCVIRLLAATDNRPSVLRAFDLVPERTQEFLLWGQTVLPESRWEPAQSLEEAIAACTTVVFATTALRPYVPSSTDLGGKVVLHLSLRDLAPESLLDAVNVVDDVQHASREGTSFGKALAIDPRLHVLDARAVLSNKIAPTNAAIVFSPFGLGVLDIALADLVSFLVEPSVRVSDFAQRWYPQDPYGVST